MEPIVIGGKVVSDYVVGKLIDKIISRVHVDVIQRWSKHRAEAFFKAFCQEISRERSSLKWSDNVDVLLDMVLENDTRSEVLFEAYRRVCITRSKNLGPRIIGILTAQLVMEESTASAEEEMIFMAAEHLNDDELLSFVSFYEENNKIAMSSQKKKDVRFDRGGDLEIKWAVEHTGSSWLGMGSNISLAPLNLGECLGIWALKLKPFGFILDDVREREWHYEADSERHIDEAGTAREVSWWVKIPNSSFRFLELIKRAASQKPE